MYMKGLNKHFFPFLVSMSAQYSVLIKAKAHKYIFIKTNVKSIIKYYLQLHVD